MARILSLPNVRALLLDFDFTMYHSEEYQRDGHQGEIRRLANELHVSEEAALSRFQEARARLTSERNQQASRGQTMLALGMTSEWWKNVRLQCWHPEEFLRPNTTLAECLRKLAVIYRIAVVSNSPALLVRRGLKALACDEALNSAIVIGPENTEPKPSLQPYMLAANLLGLPANQCLSVGDDPEKDCYPAIQLGMGAAVVDGPTDLLQLLTDLVAGAQSAQNASWINWVSLLQDWYRPGRVTLVGNTGLSGAGKTTTTTNLYHLGRVLGLPVYMVDQDWYFRRSRAERTAWLEEGKGVSAEEHARRSDLLTWWDFDRQEADLQRLCNGQSVSLRGVYNRADGGEKTLDVDITVDPKQGTLVLYDGPALCHFKSYFNALTFVHTSRPIRHDRLRFRDKHRTGLEADERIRVTDETWHRYFNGNLGMPDAFVNNNSIPYFMEAAPALHEL